MEISIIGRHTKISDEVRARIETKIEKIAALAPRATQVEVLVIHDRHARLSEHRERVEITIRGKKVIRSQASGEHRLEALEIAADRALEQLRRVRERKISRFQQRTPIHALPVVPAASEEANAAVGEADASDPEVENIDLWDGAPEEAAREIPLDGTPILIRSKRHRAVPMSVAQAVDEMELVGHDFFLFHDIETDLPSAVYRRRGWTYGVLHLETESEVAAAEAAGA